MRDWTAASADVQGAEVGNHKLGHGRAVVEFVGHVVAAGLAHFELQFGKHLVEHFCRLEGDLATFLGRRASEDVDGDFDEPDVGFAGSGGDWGVCCAIVEETEHNEDGGCEANEVHGFAFVKGLHFACSQCLVKFQNLAGPVHTCSAAVRESVVHR